MSTNEQDGQGGQGGAPLGESREWVREEGLPDPSVSPRVNRRMFLATAAAVPALAAAETRPVPKYRIVTPFKPTGKGGAPGLYPGRVVTVHSPKCIDEVTEKVDVPTVKEMMSRGMTELTGDKDARDSWARFFNQDDFVGIEDQLLGRAERDVDAGHRRGNRHPADGRRRQAHEHRHPRTRRRADPQREIRKLRDARRARRVGGYDGSADPRVYCEVNFFGEEDTRSLSDADGDRAVHEDHQRAEHEGSRRVGRHGVLEEHRYAASSTTSRDRTIGRSPRRSASSARWRPSGRCDRARC